MVNQIELKSRRSLEALLSIIYQLTVATSLIKPDTLQLQIFDYQPLIFFQTLQLPYPFVLIVSRVLFCPSMTLQNLRLLVSSRPLLSIAQTGFQTQQLGQALRRLPFCSMALSWTSLDASSANIIS